MGRLTYSPMLIANPTQTSTRPTPTRMWMEPDPVFARLPPRTLVVPKGGRQRRVIEALRPYPRPVTAIARELAGFVWAEMSAA